MKRLRGGFGSSAHLWLRGTVLLVAATLAAHAGMAQSIRLVPSTVRFAGSPPSGPQGGTNQDDGPAASTRINGPTYVTSDIAGDIYIADTGNNCIRRVDTAGNMTVAVGQSTGGGSDTCQSQTPPSDYTAGLLNPSGVALDNSGNLFVADTGHNCVRRLTNTGTGVAALQPLVGTCTDNATTSIVPEPAGLAVDAAGNLYIAINDTTDGIYQVLRSSAPNYGTVCLLSGTASGNVSNQCNNIPATSGLKSPQGLTIDPIGNLYFADSGNACVREISNVGVPSTAVGSCNGSATNTPLQAPVGVAADAAGHLYINDATTATVNAVYELVGGQLLQVAGDGQTGTYAVTQEGKAAVTVPLNMPQGLAADKSGNVYLADTGNNIVRVLEPGLRFPETVVGNRSTQESLWFLITKAVNLSPTGQGEFPIVSSQCSGAKPAPANGQIETCQISLRFQPALPGIRTSALTITDSATSPATPYRFGLSGIGQSAEAIFIPGTIKTIAKGLTSPAAIAIDSLGDVYYAEGNPGSGSVSVLSAGAATPTQLLAPGVIATPTALALDAAGNLYIADATTGTVQRYDANGIRSTVVTNLDNPVAIAVDPLGDFYIAEDGATNGVLEVYAGGQQSIIAGQGASTPNGGLAVNAKFVKPSALYLDPTGILYVADSGAYRVYRIDTAAGSIGYFAGNGTPTDTNGGAGTRLGTGLGDVTALSADAAGDIYIADAATSQIFLAFSGAAQNPSMEVLAGTGTAGSAGDNGPANKAELSNPMAVAVDGAANVYIADTGNQSLREITYADPTLDFGVVKVGQTGGPLSTTLWNAGNDTLQPLANAVLDDTVNFGVDAAGTGCGNSISPGATCNLSFVFTPQSPGSFIAHDTLTDSSVNPTQVVTLIGEAPKTTLTAPNVTVVYGDPYTLNASVTGNLTNAPTGDVTFSFAGTALCPPQPLPANGQVSCMPSITPLLDVGVYPITVTYTGDSVYDGASATLQLTVVPRPITIKADDKTRAINTPNPTLTGTVTNAVVPGQSITATYSTTAVLSSPAGGYPIVPAAVLGSGVNPADYTIILINGTLTITDSSGGTPPGGGGGTPPGGGGGNPPPGGGGGNPPPGGGGGTGGGGTGSFTLAGGPGEQEIDHNGTINYTVTMASTGGFTGPIALACSGLPEGATCAFSPASVTLASAATGTSTMTITATADNTNVPTIFSKLGTAPAKPEGGNGPLLAWTMLPLGLGGSAGTLMIGAAGRRRRKLMLLVPFALLLVLGMSGCAGPNNYKIYTVTVTGTATSGGATITKSSTVDMVLAR